MRSTRKNQLKLAFAAVLPGVLLAFFAFPAGAQPVDETHPAPSRMIIYDSAHEVTINGTVQTVVAKHVPGSPSGMHLLVSGTQGTVDAHVGPFLPKNIRQAMHMGLPLEMVGAMTTVRGKQFLLVRQLIYGGQTITVRNSHGFLLAPARSSLDPSPKTNGKLTLNGGGL
jgi:hypothetical protein